VPLTVGGDLTVRTSSDLGGLGGGQGLPVAHAWSSHGLAPLLPPWLVLLALFILKPNRRAAAWLIWLPLAIPIALVAAPLPGMPSETNFLTDAVVALAVALAGVWLLSDYVARRHRFFTFLLVLLVLAFFSALGFGSQQGWSVSMETIQGGILLAWGVVVTALSVLLTGLTCRGRYRPFGTYAWLALWLPVVWIVMGLPLFWYITAKMGGRITWGQFVGFALAVAVVNFATLLPFLILASASPCYRERLKGLLHTKSKTPAPITPLPAATLKTIIDYSVKR
jgi:hypothetical protein